MGRVDDWGYPHLLLGVLCVVLLVAVVYGSATSATALGTYNVAWNGASELRGIAGTTDTEVVIGTNLSQYDTVEPNQTISFILSPQRGYTPAETARIREFVRNGGTVVIAEDFRPHAAQLLSALGVPFRVRGVPVRDERRYGVSPAFPQATNVTAHPYTDGVSQVTLNRGTVLQRVNASGERVRNTTVLVQTSEFAYLDRNGNQELDQNETLRQRPVAAVTSVGNGSVVVVADPSVFLNSMLREGGNRRFTRNLLAAHQTMLLDYSHNSGQPLLATLVISLRQSVAVLVAALCGLLLSVWLLWRSWGGGWLQRVTGGDGESEVGGGPVDPAAMRAHLQEEYPEWDHSRIDRVIAGLNAESNETDEIEPANE